MLRDIVRSRTSAVSLVQRTTVILGAFDRIDNQDIAEERRVHFVGRIGKNRYSPHFDKVKHSRLTILRIMLTVTDFGGRLVFDFRQLIARNARRPFVPTT